MLLISCGFKQVNNICVSSYLYHIQSNKGISPLFNAEDQLLSQRILFERPKTPDVFRYHAGKCPKCFCHMTDVAGGRPRPTRSRQQEQSFCFQSWKLHPWIFGRFSCCIVTGACSDMFRRGLQEKFRKNVQSNIRGQLEKLRKMSGLQSISENSRCLMQMHFYHNLSLIGV